MRVLDRALRVALGLLERALEEDDALGDLAARGPRRGRRRPCGAARRARSPSGPSTPRTVNCQVPGRLDRELARPAHAVDVGVDGVQLGLQPPSPAGRLVLDDGRSFSWPSRKMSAETATVSPTVRLTAYRPPSRTGAGFAILIRRGAFTALRCGHLAVEYPTSRSHEPLSYLRGAAAPDLVAVRTPRSGRLRLGRLARRGRPDVVADAAAWRRPTSTARRTSRRRRSPPRRSCWPSRPRPSAGDERARLPRAGRRTGSRTGSRSRARTALDDQVRFDREWTALRALCRRPRREADRRHPDLRRRRLRRPARPPRAVQARRRGGRAAGRVHRRGPAVGQPAL